MRTARTGAMAAEPLLIVFAYPEGILPNPWFRAYRRAKKTISRGGYYARVDLLPITALPASVAVLVLPPELAEQAQAAVGVGERLIGAPQGIQPELDGIVRRLVDEGRLAYAPDQPRALAVHRGFLAVTERARVAE